MSDDNERDPSAEAIIDDPPDGDAGGADDEIASANADSADADSTDDASDAPDASDASETDAPEHDPAPPTAPGEDEAVDEADVRQKAKVPDRRWPAMLIGTPRWMIVVQILLAPLLAAGAMGVHWWLNVPEHIIESPRDQGAKNKKKKKNKRRSSRNKNKNKKDKNASNDRTPEELEEQWERYREEPFEDEPVLAVWARRHQGLINRAVVVARRQAFEGAPEQPRVVLNGTKCHTVRCSFKLRSKYPHALDSVADTLSRLQSKEQDVWRTFELSPAPTPEGEQEHYVEFLVSFRTDTTDSRSLSIRPSPMLDAPADGSLQAEPPAKPAE